MGLQDDLLDIERLLWTGGPDAYRASADGTCLVVFTEMAGIYDRETIARSAEGGRWKNLRIEPVGFVELSPDSVILTYEAAAVREREHHRALCSSAYVKREDGWKLAFHQQTPLTDDEEE